LTAGVKRAAAQCPAAIRGRALINRFTITSDRQNVG
jgi:hypothetical protein